jgi:quercetin dioxygenase-like cupin family protein
VPWAWHRAEDDIFDNLVYDSVNHVVEGIPMSLITAAHTRHTDTPNATMITCASPSLGGSAGLSLWKVQMRAGARGPLHVVDSEQLWTVVRGEIAVTLEGTAHDLAAGDTIVLAAGRERQIAALRSAEAVVCGHGSAIVSVPGEDAPRGTPPWIA